MGSALDGLTLDTFVDPRRHALLWLLAGFAVTALLTRVVTRRIRARKARAAQVASDRGLLADVHIGGIHVHHQVWGILLSLLVGLLLVAYQPTGPVLDVLAATFGAGAALALDEFAMWLHLKDVYWATEGRASISALMTAAVIVVVMALGSAPLGLETDQPVPGLSGYLVAATVLVNLVPVVIAVLKGKLPSALVGVFVPNVSLVAAWRLAKPGSWWSNGRYPPGSRKRERSEHRFGPAYHHRWQRIHDALGGSPTEPAPPVQGIEP